MLGIKSDALQGQRQRLQSYSSLSPPASVMASAHAHSLSPAQTPQPNPVFKTRYPSSCKECRRRKQKVRRQRFYVFPSLPSPSPCSLSTPRASHLVSSILSAAPSASPELGAARAELQGCELQASLHMPQLRRCAHVTLADGLLPRSALSLSHAPTVPADSPSLRVNTASKKSRGTWHGAGRPSLCPGHLRDPPRADDGLLGALADPPLRRRPTPGTIRTMTAAPTPISTWSRSVMPSSRSKARLPSPIFPALHRAPPATRPTSSRRRTET